MHHFGVAKAKASLTLEAKDKAITLTGRQESSWNEVITFHGTTITYRFVAKEDGDKEGDGSLINSPGADDWGFRFTVR